MRRSRSRKILSKYAWLPPCCVKARALYTPHARSTRSRHVRVPLCTREETMRHSYWIVFAIITVFSGAQPKADSVLPDNFELPRDLAVTVTELYGQSATFRAQCDRLAQTPNLRVAMRFDGNMRSSCRAFSIIRRRGGSLCVEVHVP